MRSREALPAVAAEFLPRGRKLKKCAFWRARLEQAFNGRLAWHGMARPVEVVAAAVEVTPSIGIKRPTTESMPLPGRP